MECSSCRSPLPGGALFCHRCGAQQSASSCGGCGAELLPEAAFCSRCGTAAGAPGDAPDTRAGSRPVAQRRLTSVLFADLVSYTTLAEARDTEDVRELLTAYFDTCSTVIRRYGGSVEKFIGDAVMAVWGVPTAHEDDAERAVRAGLELVAQVTELGQRRGVDGLALRVGVVTGEVAATVGAVDQGMVAGDPVNTAARVQATAGPGEVWVDATTRSLTAAAVTYVDTGEHQLKGKAEPMRLHRAGTVVAAVGGLQRVDGLEAPLVGRDRELRLLKEHFHATEESGRSQLVVLDGEAGVGKTRLGWEFEKYVDGLSSTVRWHRGRCLSYGEGVAFWALAEAVRGRVGLLENDSGNVVLEGLDKILAERVTDDAERQWLRPRVASLLGEEAREFAREDLFAAWLRFLERIGAGDPVVLLIDDAQHLDEGLVEFLEYLVGAARFGCFVLLLARPELLAARPQLGGRRATVLRVDPLPDPAMAELVDGLVDGLPADVRRALVDRSEGIPLFAVETVRALIDRDVVVPVEGRYLVAAGQAVDLATLGAPASLQALVAARLDALAPDERRVLSDASVLGESFTRHGIGILAGDVDDLDGVLSALARKELIATELDPFSAERGQFRFVQSVVRQVAYSTVSRRDRKTRHLLVADHLAGETDRADELAQVIAQHLLDAAAAAGDADPEAVELRARAGRLLVRAAERATSLGAYADATRSYESAFECLAEPAERARVLRAQAMIQVDRGRLAESLDLAQRSTDLFVELGDELEAARSAYHAARALGLLDRIAESLELATAWRDRTAGLAGADRVRGLLASAIAVALLFSGRYEEVDGPLWEALSTADRTDDFEMFRVACNVLGVLLSRRGSYRMARIVLRGLAEEARRREHWRGLTIALGNDATVSAPRDLMEARRLTEDSVATAIDHGMPPDENLLANLMHYAWLSGDWDRTLAVVRDTTAVEQPLVLQNGVAAAMAALCTWAGREVHRDDRPGPLPPGDGQFAGIYDYAAAAEALAAGDREAALRLLAAVVDQELSLNGPSDDLQMYWPLAMRVAVEAGHRESVDGLWTLHRVIREQLPEGSALAGHALVFRALLGVRDGGRPEQFESELRAGIDVLDRCGVVVWRAHAQEDLGRWLADQGRADEAAPLLEAARATYEGLGATRWLARVDGLLTEPV